MKGHAFDQWQTKKLPQQAQIGRFPATNIGPPLAVDKFLCRQREVTGHSTMLF